jgi:hypothetical protein
MKRCDALMAVMRKMLIVSYHLVKTKQDDDPTKVSAVGMVQPAG